MPKSQTKRDEAVMYVAVDTGSADIDGVPTPYFRGRTRVREGHPLLRAAAHAFQPIEAHYDVEQATAAPGEKRGDK